MKFKFSAVASVVSLLLISACGGGGGDAPVAVSPAGLWIGTTNTNRAVTGIVLGDGTYYVLYSSIGNANVIAGVVQGTGTSNGATFSSVNTKDFNFEGLGVLSARVDANVVARQSFNGAISYAVGTTTFNSNYDARFEIIPTLAAVAGTYTGQVALSPGVQAANVTVSPTGVLAGGAGGCAISGTAVPRADGNAYNATIAFGPAPCFFANQTFTGVAYFDAGTKRLYAAAPNAARTAGVLFVGTKP